MLESKSEDIERREEGGERRRRVEDKPREARTSKEE
jgi:hypothetical protein